MSDPAKVRLARCPKCGNLLPELTGYSVDKCGGCDAVLRARNRNRNLEEDTYSVKSDEEGVRGVPENFYENSEKSNFSEKGMNSCDGPENDVKSNGSSSRRIDNCEASSNKSEKHKNVSTIAVDTQVLGNDSAVNQNLDESVRAEIGKEHEEFKPPSRFSNASRRTKRASNWSGAEEDIKMPGRDPRMDAEGVRYSTLKYSEEGPSDHEMRSGYDYGGAPDNWHRSGNFNKVEYLERDRAELLRRLDELRDQLSRSCEVNERPKEKVPFDRRMGQGKDPYGVAEAWFPNGSSGSSSVPMKYAMPDMLSARHPYSSQNPELAPYTNRHEMGMNRFYPGLSSNHVQRFKDPLGSQMPKMVPGRAPYQATGPFQRQLSHPYFTGRYMENDIEPFEPYPNNTIIHHPSCSCFHCYGKNPQVPARVPPNAFRDTIFPEISSKPMIYHHENPTGFGPRDYNPQIGNPPSLSSHIPQSHTRWPSDFSSEAGGFAHNGPPKVLLGTSGRHCLPVAGGSPFLTCYNCFELLQVPRKILFLKTNRKKLQCGACLTVLLLAVVDKKLVVSVCKETKITPQIVDGSPQLTMNDGSSHVNGQTKRASLNFSSDDYDNSGYDFQAMDGEVISSSTGQGSSSSKSAEMRGLRSVSLYSSEDDNSPDSSKGRGKESNSPELPTKAKLSPPPAGSPLQEYFDYSNKNRAVNRFGNGNRSGCSERDVGMLKKAILHQSSMNDVSLATETDVSFEYSNTGTSQELVDTSREEDRPRTNKGHRPSFFAGFIKKSSRDFSKSSHACNQETINVTVNGHAIPDHLANKAEKLAGPIQHGDYWYDSRAGFWGVMGGPCLGIIPPFIEELNHPMPGNCAGGDTGVFVNGRELHPKDLDLLCCRGLPRATNKSYIIEISGRVLDEGSGEELKGLGKLASTVEKVKHGFGMKPPRVAA